MKSEGLTPAQLAERNAEYVTEISRLEKACAALAAENAGLKHAMAVTLEHVSVTDAGQAGVAAMIINDALHHSETPATDAFLAEIRAAARNGGLTIPQAVLLLLSTTDLSISLYVKFSTLRA